MTRTRSLVLSFALLRKSSGLTKILWIIPLELVWIPMKEGKEGKRNRRKGKEEKGRGMESSIFLPNLSIFGKNVFIKE